MLGVFAKKITPHWVQLLVANKEKFSHRSFVRSHQGKKTEQRTGLACDISADKLLRNAFRDSEDVPCVLVIVPHERLATELAVPRRIIEPFCDLFLQVNMKYVGRASCCVMQGGAQAQEKIVRLFYSALVAFTQPVFPHELVRAQGTLFEIGHPKKILIIAQSAASAFQVRLLQIDAVAEFLVPGDLILHAQFHVFAFISVDALRTKLPPKFSCQLGIAREKPRFQHGSLCAHVLIGLSERFFNRARGVSNFEATVP